MENNTVPTTHKRFYFEWLLPFLFRPRRLAGQIAQKRATWLTPLLVVSLLIAARVWFTPVQMVSIPLENTPPINQAPMGMSETYLVSAQAGGGAGNGGGVTVPDGGTPPTETTTPTGSPIVSMISAIASLWVGWFLLSVLLYVGMVISGSNNSFTETLNLVGWSSLPLGLRQIPLMIAALTIPSLASNPSGLASITTTMSGPTGMFLTALLKLVDIYLIWQLILILLALGKISPLPFKRALGVTLGAMGIFLVLAAMPGFFSVIFTQLTQPVPGNF